jgi:hypothetical protein
MTDIFDTANIPSGEPEKIFVGDLVRWRRTDLSNTYDPTLYTLKYSARKAGSDAAVEVEITATSDATGWYVDESAVDTDDWECGTYHWQLYVIRNSDSERIAVDRGRWEFYRNFDLSKYDDPRSHAEKMVDMLEAVLENRAGNDIIYYMIGGRAISKIPIQDLRKLLVEYRQEVSGEIDAERRARGKSSKNKITARFV